MENLPELKQLLDSPRFNIRNEVRSIIGRKEFHHFDRSSTADYRESVWRQIQILGKEGIGRLGIPAHLGGSADPKGFLTAIETLAEGDLSLLIKFGVQFGLFGGSIQNLGTTTHHRLYLADAMSASLPGCFAMTESNHGSNVAALETMITYTPQDDSFLVHTPNYGAGKDYIGNAACHAQLASVFGQLIVDGCNHGVHCILVPIRDAQGNPLPNVTISDDGEKMGLNGVDNGRLWFDHVKVPRANLLNRFGGVDNTGTYTSPITSKSRRFFTMLSTLVGGRVSIGLGALTASKRALKIAVDHSLDRRQFGAPDQPEIRLIDYPTHQERLIPRLAKTYALHFSLRNLVEKFGEDDAVSARIYEQEAAALKAASTWHATDTIQACREACGGQGYLSKMGFTDLKGDTDIFATFEGDNTVLQLLVAKELLKSFGQRFKKRSLIGFLKFRSKLSIDSWKALSGNPSVPELLELRQRMLTFHLGTAIRERVKQQHMSTLEAFNAEGPNLLHLAEAYSENLIYSRFRDAVKQNPITCLEHMLELYGLDCLRRDSGWMQRKGLLSAGQAGIITRRRAELIRLLRTDVGPLAEALTPESGGKLNANHLIDRSEIQQEKSPAEFCGRLV